MVEEQDGQVMLDEPNRDKMFADSECGNRGRSGLVITLDCT